MNELNQNFESKLKEAIAKVMRYERTLKKNETDQDYRMAFASSIIKGIDSKYYDVLANIIERTGVTITVPYSKSCNPSFRYYGITPNIKVGYFDDSETFAHECGHLADHHDVHNNEAYFYSLKPFKGCNLHITLIDEFNANKEKIFKKFKEELNASLEEEFGEKALDVLEQCYRIKEVKASIAYDVSFARYGSNRLSLAHPKATKPRNEKYVSIVNKIANQINSISDDSSLDDYILMYRNSKTYKEICKNYGGTISDMLSSTYDLNPYGLGGHTIKYFEQPSLLSQEFFAEFFSYKLTNNISCLERTKKLFPRTFKMAEVVFNYVLSRYESR